MKQILLFICLASLFQSKAQNKDTLFIPPGKYKFVKIGDNTYKIASPSLQLVPNEPPFIGRMDTIINKPYIPSTREVWYIYNNSELFLNVTTKDTAYLKH